MSRHRKKEENIHISSFKDLNLSCRLVVGWCLAPTLQLTSALCWKTLRWFFSYAKYCSTTMLLITLHSSNNIITYAALQSRSGRWGLLKWASSPEVSRSLGFWILAKRLQSFIVILESERREILFTSWNVTNAVNLSLQVMLNEHCSCST